MQVPMIATLTAIEADSENKLPTKVHLLRSGKFATAKYGDLDINSSDLSEFVDNYNKGYGRAGHVDAKGPIPINFGHDKGGKAAGWVNKLEADANGDLWGSDVQWSTAGKAAIEGHEYKFLSSEFTPRCLGGEWTNPENTFQKIRNVFTGVALTNIPMFSGNRGLMASAESTTDSGDDKQVIYISATKEQSMDLAQLRVKDSEKLTADERKFVEAHASELSPEEKKKFNIEASAEGDKTVTIEAAATSTGVVSVDASEIKKLVDANAELTKKVEASESAKSDLQKTVDAHAQQLTNMRSKEVEASVDAAIEQGKIVADQKETWVKTIMADAEMETVLDKIPANKLVEASAIGSGSTGTGAAEASAEVVARTNKLMSENKDLKPADATAQVLASDTKLAAEYAAELKAAVN